MKYKLGGVKNYAFITHDMALIQCIQTHIEPIACPGSRLSIQIGKISAGIKLSEVIYHVGKNKLMLDK